MLVFKSVMEEDNGKGKMGFGCAGLEVCVQFYKDLEYRSCFRVRNLVRCTGKHKKTNKL